MQWSSAGLPWSQLGLTYNFHIPPETSEVIKQATSLRCPLAVKKVRHAVLKASIPNTGQCLCIMQRISMYISIIIQTSPSAGDTLRVTCQIYRFTFGTHRVNVREADGRSHI